MPLRVYKCNKCSYEKEYIIGSTTGETEPTECPECGEIDSMEKQFGMSGISGDVVGGYDYTYGKKAWKRNKSVAEKASILAGDSDPY